MKPEIVWLYFRPDTVFGNKILFVPTPREFPGFRQNPVVTMLNAMAETNEYKSEENVSE